MPLDQAMTASLHFQVWAAASLIILPFMTFSINAIEIHESFKQIGLKILKVNLLSEILSKD